MSDFSEAHDRWLADYHMIQPVEVWCVNESCANHERSTAVRFEAEYGQGWYTPEECNLCGGEWTEEQPEEEEEEDEDLVRRCETPPGQQLDLGAHERRGEGVANQEGRSAGH